MIRKISWIMSMLTLKRWLTHRFKWSGTTLSNYWTAEVVARSCFVKKVFWKISQNSQVICIENTWAQVFSCQFCEIFKNSLFYRKRPVAASETVAPVSYKDFKFVSFDTLLVSVESSLKNISSLDSIMSD